MIKSMIKENVPFFGCPLYFFQMVKKRTYCTLYPRKTPAGRFGSFQLTENASE